ncbi:16S rRNA processing protein RimM [Arcobacter nitrofigilis DSM 7299]|uniref:Ribosome maturation factor RimM n=1 Tax=Arcobacter nitrofigilis (strain ATCC 33309 / DSM 7299 / CCUG 15893 / LMG 7604 / NCTC 12251 / CI) TaxID=572480 RepID=D5V689_ARCNC|nr:ribosome maturation factor RimM [Arcobacter nitrofigilis]ADG94159.1 16S rRNA processing protein RimM [Arcobacter nitrofigilis DSM 7299]
MKNKIYVAKLGKSVGLNGEIKIFLDSDFPEQFKKGAIFITNKGNSLTVNSFNESRGTINFVEINNIDDAKKLTNQQLFTSQENTKENCKLNKDQFFWFDLIDCMVFENEENLGTIIEIHRYPLGDYFEIKTETSLVEKNLPKTFLLPYEKNYIKSVDIKSKKIEAKDAKAILENS